VLSFCLAFRELQVLGDSRSSTLIIRDLAMTCMNFPGLRVTLDTRAAFEITPQLGRGTIQHSLLVQHEFQYYTPIHDLLVLHEWTRVDFSSHTMLPLGESP
jgi:hypothetical protein